MGALARAVPDSVGGEVKGTAQHVYMGGANPRRGDAPFLYYEYPSGGTGGHSDGDGNEATKEYSSGDFSSIHPVEAVENEFPIFVERTELRQDSEGSGHHRGGVGLRRDIRIDTSKALFSVLSDHNVIPPYGVLGGYWGAPNTFTIIRKGEEFQPAEYPGKISGFELRQGDIVIERSSGGGGYGDPLVRDAELVANDAMMGYISARRAEERYGVIIRKGKVDIEATIRLRRELDLKRVKLKVQTNGLVADGNRRFAMLHPSSAHLLDVVQDDLMECVNMMGAPLRVWATILDECPKDAIWVSPQAFSYLSMSENDVVWIRKVTLDPKLRV